MKVLVVNPTSGIRVITRMVCEKFPDRDHEITVFTPEDSTGIEEKNNVSVEHYNTRYVPGIRYTIPGADFYTKAKELIEWCDACLIVTYCYLPSTAASVLASLLETKNVVVVNNLIGVEWSYGNRIVDAVGIVYTHSLGRLTFRCADDVVGQGEYVRRPLQRFSKGGKVTIIDSGVDTERYSPEGSSVNDSPGDTIKLLYVGRLDPVKNVPGLLKAFSILEEANQSFELTIVGDGTKREEYEELTHDLGIADDVTFEGYQEEVADYYNENDIFVLTSKAEGPPAVVREAQASGLPVVATDVGGVRDIVHSGALVNDTSPQLIAQGIRELASYDLEKLGEIARRNMVENFDIERTVDEYISILENDGKSA